MPGQGQGHKRPKCKGLNMVKKNFEQKTACYIFVIPTHSFGPIGLKFSENVQNTMMNEICFVICDILIFENFHF